MVGMACSEKENKAKMMTNISKDDPFEVTIKKGWVDALI